MRVAPDAYFMLRTAGKVRHCFREVDRSTEELDRLKRKYVNYWWYLQSPEFVEALQPGDAVVVLFVTTGETRMRNMMAALERLKKPNRARHAKRGLFWFCTDGDYALEDPVSVLRAIWRAVGVDAGARRTLGAGAIRAGATPPGHGLAPHPTLQPGGR